MQSSPTLIFLVAALAALARAAPGPRFSNPVFYDENYSANYEVNPINPIGEMDDQESAKLLSDDNLFKKEGFSDQPLKDNMKSAVDGRPGRSKEDKLKAKSDNPFANDIYRGFREMIFFSRSFLKFRHISRKSFCTLVASTS